MYVSMPDGTRREHSRAAAAACLTSAGQMRRAAMRCRRLADGESGVDMYGSNWRGCHHMTGAAAAIRTHWHAYSPPRYSPWAPLP